MAVCSVQALEKPNYLRYLSHSLAMDPNSIDDKDWGNLRSPAVGGLTSKKNKTEATARDYFSRIFSNSL